MNLFNSRSEEQSFAYKIQKVKVIYVPLFNINMFPMFPIFSINKWHIYTFQALQEFSSLCKEKDEESVKAVLPFWPRIYNKMAIVRFD